MNDKLYNRDEIFRQGDENYNKNMMGEKIIQIIRCNFDLSKK